MKKYILILALALVFSCKKDTPAVIVPAAEPVKGQSEIVPKVNTKISSGLGIGNVTLEMDAARLSAILGTPDLSDAAMGKAWQTWYSTNSEAMSGKYELNIFTNYKDSEMTQKVVRLIRVTSPDFKTADSLGTGMSFGAFAKHHPDFKYVGSYTYEDTKYFVELYDDRKAGIAFEFLDSGEGKHCIAVLIHEKGKKVIELYRTFRPDLVLAN